RAIGEHATWATAPPGRSGRASGRPPAPDRHHHQPRRDTMSHLSIDTITAHAGDVDRALETFQQQKAALYEGGRPIYSEAQQARREGALRATLEAAAGRADAAAERAFAEARADILRAEAD